MHPKSSVWSFDLLSVAPMFLIGWQCAHDGVSLIRLQQTCRKQWRKYTIASIAVFVLLVALCLYAGVSFSPKMPVGSGNWWAFTLFLAAALATYFWWISVVKSYEAEHLRKFIRLHSRGLTWLTRYRYKIPEPVDEFVRRTMLQLDAANARQEYGIGEELWKNFNYTPPRFDFELDDGELSQQQRRFV